jgi:hypothetical protein
MSASESPAKTVTFPFQQGQPGAGAQQPVPQQYRPPQPPQ